MRFNPKARLDTSRVRDAGRSGGGGGGLGGGGRRGGSLPIPTSTGGIGGVGGVVVVVIAVVVYLVANHGGGTAGSLDAGRFTDTGRYASCQTGDDANNSTDCARVAIENSLVSYWSGELGQKFQPEAGITTFDGRISTGCGPASEEVGPFYCPADETIYLDTGFYDEVLQRQLGGPGGGFVEAYVLAHEFGHHIQNLMGTMGKVKGDTGPQSSGVRLELQADCYAGMWAKSATTTQDADGQVLIEDLTTQDIQLALDAAASVGDDRIQQKTQGQVNTETFTHGSADQRMHWFQTGYTTGSLQACDTFGASTV